MHYNKTWLQTLYYVIFQLIILLTDVAHKNAGSTYFIYIPYGSVTVPFISFYINFHYFGMSSGRRITSPGIIEQGLLEGLRETSVLSGMEYFSFRGIPYAQPPIGELRFQPPVPSSNWNGVLRATGDKDCCQQREVLSSSEIQLKGSEDCLYINVYTPAVSSNCDEENLKPVMVFFHGGAFLFGSSSSDSYSVDTLINKNVVIVLLNYRLHIFGFLNLGIPECRGNCGLKDQLLALQWIKYNIREFGGDPQNVTLFGNSSGACSIFWHVVSPLSRKKQLFHKAIMQSGTALSYNAFVHNPTEKAFLLGSRLGYDGDNPLHLLNFLRQQPADKLTTAVYDLYFDKKQGCSAIYHGFAFVPSLEIIDVDAFISDLPENLIRLTEPMPIVAGICNRDGILVFRHLTEEMLQEYDDDFSKVLKRDCTLNMDISQSQLSLLASKLKQYYFGDRKVSWQTKEQFVEVMTDVSFLRFYDAFEFVKKDDSHFYVYEFAFDGLLNLNKPKFVRNRFSMKGACHGDEIGYLFYSRKLPQVQLSVRETKMIECLCTLWTNFARTGNPTPDSKDFKWPSSTKTNPCYLEINDDLQLKHGIIRKQQQEFWRKVIEETTSK